MKDKDIIILLNSLKRIGDLLEESNKLKKQELVIEKKNLKITSNENSNGSSKLNEND